MSLFYSFGIAKYARFVEWGYIFEEQLFPKRVQWHTNVFVDLTYSYNNHIRRFSPPPANNSFGPMAKGLRTATTSSWRAPGWPLQPPAVAGHAGALATSLTRMISYLMLKFYHFYKSWKWLENVFKGIATRFVRNINIQLVNNDYIDHG